MDITPGMGQNFPRDMGVRLLSAIHKESPESYSKRAGGNPRNSSLCNR